jgi:hypothetical protein
MVHPREGWWRVGVVVLSGGAGRGAFRAVCQPGGPEWVSCSRPKLEILERGAWGPELARREMADMECPTTASRRSFLGIGTAGDKPALILRIWPSDLLFWNKPAIAALIPG